MTNNKGWLKILVSLAPMVVVFAVGYGTLRSVAEHAKETIEVHVFDRGIHEDPDTKANRIKVLVNEAVAAALKEIRDELRELRKAVLK